jgi:hypothetical protein
LSADDIKRKLIKIEELASHMTNLLENVLTVGKAEAGKVKVMRVECRSFLNLQLRYLTSLGVIPDE